MFEAIEFIEIAGIPEPTQNHLGEYEDDLEAVEAARAARREFMSRGTGEYAWWVVREPGQQLAQFIADSKSDKEFVLDLTTGQLVEV